MLKDFHLGDVWDLFAIIVAMIFVIKFDGK